MEVSSEDSSEEEVQIVLENSTAGPVAGSSSDSLGKKIYQDSYKNISHELYVMQLFNSYPADASLLIPLLMTRNMQKENLLPKLKPIGL